MRIGRDCRTAEAKKKCKPQCHAHVDVKERVGLEVVMMKYRFNARKNGTPWWGTIDHDEKKYSGGRRSSWLKGLASSVTTTVLKPQAHVAHKSIVA